MRGCHSETMQDYRRVHNLQMWERLGLPTVEVPTRDSRIAEYNIECRIRQAIKLYIEEAGIGE